ncbi:MAG: sigma-54-dependent Fis family transcriptional regulator [Myxococcales bacterium]
MSRPRILFVDDQRAARELFARLIDPARFESLLADSVEAAEAVVRDERPDVVVTDLRMPKVDGLEGLDRFHAIDPDLPVILVTAFGSVETAVEAMKRGAFDYIRKPFEPSEVEILIERAVGHRNLLRENARLRLEVERARGSGGIVCRSASMTAALALLDRVAPSDLSVLILGESGTGKDLIARRIHERSGRAGRPFVSINCSAIPEHLLESELFGWEKGAFSGAVGSKAGFFAEADGGTLFLDEIGDMSLALQPKLLRVLEDGSYYPVGGRKARRADVRLVSASNQHIAERARDGRFRQDLYFRINTVQIALPPLRERPEDVALLAEHFRGRLGATGMRVPARIGASAMRALLEYAWPGNVRELSHAIERAALVCDGDAMEAGDLPPELRQGAAVPTAVSPGELLPFKDARAAFERDYLTRLLAAAGGSVQRAAALAGLHRTTLYEKLEKLGIPHGEG